MTDPGAGKHTVPRIGLLAPFGQPPRGVSPYADQLAAALEQTPGIDLKPLDLREPYPTFAHPGDVASERARNGIRWTRPLSWRRACPPGLDLLHVQYWTRISLPIFASAARRAKRMGYPVLVTVHNTKPHERMPGLALLEKRLLLFCDHIVIHHESLRADLLEADIETPATVIPHGVAFQESQSVLPSESQNRIGAPYVLAFGNVRPYKGIDVLLEAWDRLRDSASSHVLVVAGRLWSGTRNPLSDAAGRVLGLRGYSREIARRLAHAEKSGRVRFLNRFLTDAELDRLIAGSSVAVFPYRRFSAQSGAACRAAGTGAPLLVSDVGALPDLVADRARQVARSGDARELAEKLRHLLQHPDLTAELRQRQHEHVLQFSWSRVAAEHADLYRRLL